MGKTRRRNEYDDDMYDGKQAKRAYKEFRRMKKTKRVHSGKQYQEASLDDEE